MERQGSTHCEDTNSFGCEVGERVGCGQENVGAAVAEMAHARMHTDVNGSSISITVYCTGFDRIAGQCAATVVCTVREERYTVRGDGGGSRFVSMRPARSPRQCQ